MSVSRLFGLAGLMALVACGSANTPDKPQVLALANLFTSQIAARKAQRADQPVNTALVLQRAQLAGITEPLIRIRAETSGDVSLLFIAQRNGAAQIWKSPDNASFMLRDGILLQTRGLRDDLYASDITGLKSALAADTSPVNTARINRRMDGTNRLIATHYRCTVSDMGSETIVVLGQNSEARHYREDCASDTDRFANEYWIDARGTMRLSRQVVGPDFGYVTLERLID